MVVCTPAVDFAAVSEVIKGTNIKLGAENMHWKESGAYTGELSAAMLKESGVEYVILGHSERRQYFGETDATVNQRVLAAVKAGLTPIICVGEKKEEREAGYTNALVTYQTQIALSGLTADEVRHVVIAYEPVWAIGTGLTATDEQANETIGVIREAVRARLRRRGGRRAHPVRRLDEPEELQGSDGAAGDRRRPDRRRFPQGGGFLQGRAFRRIKEQVWQRNLFCFASWTASAGCRSRRSATRLRRPKSRTSTRLFETYPYTTIQASGMAVGLPEGQMGNSEVGHTNMGAGRIVYQQLTLITKSIMDGTMKENDVLVRNMRAAIDAGKAVHLMGLLGTGGVHSHIDHLFGLLDLAKHLGAKKIYVHCIMDGRDTDPHSGKGFIADLQKKLDEIGVGEIATVTGRYYAMDRDSNWDREEKAYAALVYGEGNHAEQRDGGHREELCRRRDG